MSALLAPALTFHEMTLAGKLVFMVKLCVFFVSFGFVFPTLLSH
ncbi:MAG: hypothetical protein QOK44_402 [Betaproteobacteria bacterium]|jgi:hypothetical protein|nr:hypothetical protein [Betaproteobacteria bacterium]